MASYLFVHQNFPGQFTHVTRAMAQRGDTVVGITAATRIKQLPTIPNLHVVGYSEPKGAHTQTHHYLQGLEAHIRRGQEVFRVAQALKKKGFAPDVVVSHPGWGESLFLRDAFPNARHVQYLEFFYRAEGADVDFDPEFPATSDSRCKVRIKNATQLLSFEAADAGISPTLWQKSRYPSDWHSRITQLHDGIDTSLVKPDSNASITIATDAAPKVHARKSSRPLILSRADEVLTYVARNLEPYRGFHTFMRSIPVILEQRPTAHIVIVGGDEVSYGKRPASGSTYREQYQQEWKHHVDHSRVHFVGRIPYSEYLKVLQVSSLHVYLTYPFVLSWSMLEAMSAGCVVLGSDTPPVAEVIHNGANGYLTNFFDSSGLANKASQLLDARHESEEVRAAARQTIVTHFDLQRKCLPALLSFLQKK
jgi:glycosyltransferase involved in cell wall biosynthesis